MADESVLKTMAQKLRRISILSTTEAGSGHPTTCLSSAEIVSVLFFHEMRWDPKNPSARNTDVFVLSKGHAAPILWAALSESGAIADDPMTLRKFTSKLEGHPTPRCEWVRVATGSLGQGLSAAAGMAVAKRMDGIAGRVFCLLGDGEVAEGAVWEAAGFAGFYKLDNLCAIVDVNRLGQSGPTMHEHNVEVYARRFESFGWHTIIVDGHSVPELLRAFSEARQHEGQPTAIVARTQKGKGVSFLEGKDGWHGKPLKKEEAQKAVAELGNTDVTLKVQARAYEPQPRQQFLSALPATVEYRIGQDVATREAYGAALVRLGKANPAIVVVDGDVKNSTFAEKFKAAFPDRYVECYIAEQNMVGVALGLATEGKIPFASSFAAFLTRAFDFIRMAAYSRPKHLIFCGSHAGVSIGEDGPSQMGLEDIAMFRSLPGTTVLYPSDAVSAEKLTQLAAETPGIVYLRTSRPKTRVLYSNDEMFPPGGSKVLRSSAKDRATVVAAGVTLHEALAAHDELARQGINIRVIDAYSIKPLDRATLQKAARETGTLIVVEDHVAAGGLGEAVASELAGRARIVHLCVRDIPQSGAPKELMDIYGVSAKAIANAVRSV